jgi:hypothetical protein
VDHSITLNRTNRRPRRLVYEPDHEGEVLGVQTRAMGNSISNAPSNVQLRILHRPRPVTADADAPRSSSVPGHLCPRSSLSSADR